jgi:hypothetical protein
MTEKRKIPNPFRPGAGHMPPYLAGRENEITEFKRLLEQDVILKNLVLTGLRGIGKTVLLETFKPMAMRHKWLWAGTDLSESMSISEEQMAVRLLTDLALVTSSLVGEDQRAGTGFLTNTTPGNLTYNALEAIYAQTPGLIADRLKSVLEYVWPRLLASGIPGIIFAYDEAQNLADHAPKGQFPLSLLLDVFQSLQRKEMRFMLVLTGLPTLFPKLVEARTYSERMFHVMFLERLSEDGTRDAIAKPIAEQSKCPITFSDESIEIVCGITRGYPYFIQYVCREVFDIWLPAAESGKPYPSIPASEIIRKLDSDFFAGRWARATDRQRQLMYVISMLPNNDGEFTVQEIVECGINQALDRPFSGSNVNQMLGSLSDAGLIYKNRHGKYSFAVPLLGEFIQRQQEHIRSTMWS